MYHLLVKETLFICALDLTLVATPGTLLHQLFSLWLLVLIFPSPCSSLSPFSVPFYKQAELCLS